MSTTTPASVSLPPNLISSSGQHGLISSNGTTATFLTNSTDISSWAATLPAGTKVTVTHYDASKKSSQGQLVATPTHTETIIVTQPKESNRLPSQQPPLPLLRSRLSLPPPLTR